MAQERYVVLCKTHGVESKDWDGKQVVVGRPKGKKDRLHGGCPFCKIEARKHEQAEARAGSTA